MEKSAKRSALASVMEIFAIGHVTAAVVEHEALGTLGSGILLGFAALSITGSLFFRYGPEFNNREFFSELFSLRKFLEIMGLMTAFIALLKCSLMSFTELASLLVFSLLLLLVSGRLSRRHAALCAESGQRRA